MSKLPITEADLQAYVDAVLPEARHSEIEDYLTVHSEEADRVRSYLAQNLVGGHFPEWWDGPRLGERFAATLSLSQIRTSPQSGSKKALPKEMSR